MLDKVLPTDIKKRAWVAIAITTILSVGLVFLAIYGIEDYGFAVFILLPVFIGFTPAALLGYRQQITSKQATSISFKSLGAFAVGILVTAFEGIICLVMATPIAIPFTWLGSYLGYSIVSNRPSQSLTAILILFFLVPTTAFIEKDIKPELYKVTTSIVIDATPDVVWDYVVAFPQLEEPTELLFKAGIAYPINARIEGTGVGAIRYCNFNTGSFVEPITIWEEHKRLGFDVVEYPEPMKELSLWDIDPPHLHDYFASQKGLFTLTELPDGKTKLEGTTWYYHDIKPAFYWRLWSDWTIHKIHNRVLEHIKTTSEQH